MLITQKVPELEFERCLDFSNQFCQDLLGYKPEQTSLQIIPFSEWLGFTSERNLDSDSLGIYSPRNRTAMIKGENPLSLLHEYFGHGLYCEQSLAGRELVDLERKLLGEEREEFEGRNFTLSEIKRFRLRNKTFRELHEFKEQNLGRYELFAIWAEYFFSKELGLEKEFERKYDSFPSEDNEMINSVINFSERYGNLATFYAQGIARRTTPERARKLLEEIYGRKNVDNSKLILLTGSKKPFSDIDLFASSNYLKATNNGWLDLVVFDEGDFERRINLFEAQVTHPIFAGDFVTGDKDYLEEKRRQLKVQPITEEAIEYNLSRSKYAQQVSDSYPKNSEEREVASSYSKTHFANALALKEGLRLFTKEELLSSSHSENFIELKGGIK